MFTFGGAMKKSLGLMSRVVVLGVSALVLAAPAALASPAGASGLVLAMSPGGQITEFSNRASALEKTCSEIKAAESAGDVKRARALALEALPVASKLVSELQAFVAMPGLPPEIKAGAQGVLDRALPLVQFLNGVIKRTEPGPAKGSIQVTPASAARGARVTVIVVCPGGQAGNFASDAIAFTAGTQQGDKQVTKIGGVVKPNAAPGKHAVTATCGTDKLSTTFTVTSTPPVKTNPPTKDDVSRTVVKPKGKIETGGGATALLTF
jgi:hypothetical protein